MKLSATGLALSFLDRYGSVTAQQLTPALGLRMAVSTLKQLTMTGRLVEKGKGVYVKAKEGGV